MNATSPLVPRGPDATQVAELAWTLIVGGGLVAALVAVLVAFALRRTGGRDAPSDRTWILAGGVAFPCIVLAGLIPYAVVVGNRLPQCDGPDVLRVDVTGEMWWWRVAYAGSVGTRIETANELVLPSQRRVELALHSEGVIHGLWIPGLTGMKDLIPGRVNRLCMNTGEPARLRGQCTEFCGLQHAGMAFDVRVLDSEAFERWLDRQARPAPAPADDRTRVGAELFVAHCSACHTVRGTVANGASGPDLSHAGSRESLAAGMLPNNPGTLAAWISSSQHLKPGNRMPSFDRLAGHELTALAAYLASLR